MGKRKPNEAAGDGAVSGSSDDIFKSLFGDASEQNPAASLFSEANPFKRKLCDPNLENVAEQKRRKGNKEKDSSLGLGILDQAAENKPEDAKVGSNRNGELGEGAKGNGESRKMKKRKRDELEKEYEARMYGAEATSEEGQEQAQPAMKAVGEKRKKLDDPVDMMVSKEGFDDENKLLRTVFVGNLPLKVKKKALVKEFSKFGEVESVRIRSVPLLDTKKPRKSAIMQKKVNENADSVHAYIVFKTEQSAQASLAHNMAVVGGNHVRVDRACPPRKKLKGEDASLYDHKRTVFVGNLPFDVNDEELYQLFCAISGLESSVEAIRVIRDPNLNVGKGIAYVLFKTRDAANKVARRRDLKIRDRELRLCHARADSTPSKRRNPSPADALKKSPAKRHAVDPKTEVNNKRTNAKTASYQGMRASKSLKKAHAKGMGSVKSKGDNKEKPKQRQGKRPAVAARKARAMALKEGGALITGKKRKVERQTPESGQRRKKARKFR